MMTRLDGPWAPTDGNGWTASNSALRSDPKLTSDLKAKVSGGT